MFFFLMLLMSIAAIVIWALLLGIGWRTMLALESVARTQKEIAAEMRAHPAPAPAPAPVGHEPEPAILAGL